MSASVDSRKGAAGTTRTVGVDGTVERSLGCNLDEASRVMARFQHYYEDRPPFPAGTRAADLVNQILVRIPEWSSKPPNAFSHGAQSDFGNGSSHLSKCNMCWATTGHRRDMVGAQLHTLEAAFSRWNSIKQQLIGTESCEHPTHGRVDSAARSDPSGFFDQLLSQMQSCDSFWEALQYVRETRNLVKRQVAHMPASSESRTSVLSWLTKKADTELGSILTWMEDGGPPELLLTGGDIVTLSPSDFEVALAENIPIEERDLDFEWYLYT